MTTKAAKPKKPEPGSIEDVAAAELPAKGPAATRFMLTLSPFATKLLDTAVLVEGKDRSQIIEHLIATDLAGYFAGKKEPAAGQGEG